MLVTKLGDKILPWLSKCQRGTEASCRPKGALSRFGRRWWGVGWQQGRDGSENGEPSRRGGLGAEPRASLGAAVPPVGAANSACRACKGPTVKMTGRLPSGQSPTYRSCWAWAPKRVGQRPSERGQKTGGGDQPGRHRDEPYPACSRQQRELWSQEAGHALPRPLPSKTEKLILGNKKKNEQPERITE